MNPILELRPATEQERIYTYAQSHELNMHTCCIGRLRGDFDSDGNGFYTTWEDHYPTKKTPEFKQELDQVVNALRESPEYQGLLANRSSMAARCQAQPASAMQGNYTTEYVFRANTENYAYVMRLNPTKGDYNFYVFCFEKKWLDKHIANASKGIRFITPHYKEKFRIPDGGLIRMTRPEGDYIERTVRYIDDYHIEVGLGSHGNLYHICEFAERMEANGTKVIPIRDSLPKQCYSTLASTGEIILIKRGEDGYFPSDLPNSGKEENRRVVDERNRKIGVSKAQEAAMSAGSMFGWDVPAADPRSYDKNGVLLKSDRSERGDAR